MRIVVAIVTLLGLSASRSRRLVRGHSVGDRFAKAMTDHANAAIITVGRTGLARSAYKAGQQNDNRRPKSRRSNPVGRFTSKAQLEPEVFQQSASNHGIEQGRGRRCVAKI